MAKQSLAALTSSVLADNQAAYLDYYRSKLPNSKDDDIAKVVAAYKSADPAARQQFGAGLTGGQGNWLGTYAYRMSMLSVRQEANNVLQNGLVGLAMAMKVKDWRECIMTMSVLYRAAVLLGAGGRAFQDAAPYAPDTEARELLLSFLARAEEDRQIEALGYRELNGEHGIIFIYGTQPVPEGLK
ncbi:MAG TPA: hypothetical protein VJ020_05760 [Anaerolineales bacterium]|nr:hypothetical protein [Anaerolineales bacterium]